MNGDRQSSNIKKGIVMDLVVLVIEAEDNVAEAKMFYGMSRNIKFQVLDLEVDLGEGLEDTGEDGGE